MNTLKRAVLSSALALASVTAVASPSDSDITAYQARAQVYIDMKQSPQEIAVSLGNWFGRQCCFKAISNGADGTTIIAYQEGDGNEITFYSELVVRP